MDCGRPAALSCTKSAEEPAPQPPRHRHVAAPELMSADDLNGMVLAILSGRPQPALDGSGTRQRETQAAWERLRGLVVQARAP